jgi:hypothetical protein
LVPEISRIPHSAMQENDSRPGAVAGKPDPSTIMIYILSAFRKNRGSCSCELDQIIIDKHAFPCGSWRSSLTIDDR